jgi:hypothetical protein
MICRRIGFSIDSLYPTPKFQHELDDGYHSNKVCPDGFAYAVMKRELALGSMSTMGVYRIGQS